jgi:hypothetical protein
MMNLPRALAARQRDLVRQLRTFAPPPAYDWTVERAVHRLVVPPEPAPAPEPSTDTELRPGVRVEHLADGTTTEVTALADKKPLYHTFIARTKSERANIIFRELVRSYQILMVDIAEHYGDHDHVIIGTEPKD